MRTADAIVRLSWLMALSACARSVPPNSGSESHFLAACVDSEECGKLTCIAETCTVACESDEPCTGIDAAATCRAIDGAATRVCTRSASHASASDAAAPESTAQLLGTAERLGESVDMAFIAGAFGDEQLWVRGESGALRQVSVWPAGTDWSAPPCTALTSASAGSLVAGRGRFSYPMLDATGKSLVVVEKVDCYSRRQRLVLHELATGRSWSLGTFPSTVETAVGSSSMIASAWDENGVSTLYAIDADEHALIPLDPPPGNALNAASLRLVAHGDGEELVIAVPHPVMALEEERLEIYAPMDALGPDRQFGEVRASPSRDTLCVTTRSVFEPPDSDAAQGVVIRSGRASVVDIGPFAFTCAFSASGRYIMLGGAPFELTGDDIRALSPPGASTSVDGAFGDMFYGTNAQSEVVRYDPATGRAEVLIALDVLDGLCGDDLRETPGTRLYLAEEGHRLAIVKHYCGDPDLDQSGTLGLDLQTGEYTPFETGEATHIAFDVVWAADGRVRLFSALEGGDSPSFYEIGQGAEVTVHTLSELDGILHSPAVARVP